MIVSQIVAISENNVIGKDNTLLWHLPNDLKYFKSKTSLHCVIMGRRTYQSIGKPLPNRTNIVVSANENMVADGCVLVKSIEDALIVARSNHELEAFVIGGGQIYEATLGLAERIYITKVHASFEGDTFFPQLRETEWHCISTEVHLKDEKNHYDYDFEIWERTESGLISMTN